MRQNAIDINYNFKKKCGTVTKCQKTLCNVLKLLHDW